MFYNNFCAICKQKGVKPTNVVSELGFSSGNMTNWKRGRTPKTDVLNKIAQYFDVSIDELLGTKKEAVADNLKNSMYEFVTDLTPDELNAVKAFVAGLKANRKD